MVINNFNETKNEITKYGIIKKEAKASLKDAVFLIGMSGIFLISGFSSALFTLKKNSLKLSNKPSIIHENYNNTGTELALRALRWGTFYSSISCGILFYSIWKISGATSFEEFRQKIGKILPPISKKNTPL